MDRDAEPNDQQRYSYRIEKITHRPREEDKITVVKEIKEEDLNLARLLATKCYLEEIPFLKDQYSPQSFNSYDTKKGTGYNFRLLLIDALTEEVYTVESTMVKIEKAVAAQRKEEEEIFRTLGLEYSHL